ncbi:MAG TPA: hypothetical protein VKY73_10740 [Polyangiaceae bacterium]|nr:hypothetical protein [Polyangiaceae bacterium]
MPDPAPLPWREIQSIANWAEYWARVTAPTRCVLVSAPSLEDARRIDREIAPELRRRVVVWVQPGVVPMAAGGFPGGAR